MVLHQTDLKRRKHYEEGEERNCQIPLGKPWSVVDHYQACCDLKEKRSSHTEANAPVPSSVNSEEGWFYYTCLPSHSAFSFRISVIMSADDQHCDAFFSLSEHLTISSLCPETSYMISIINTIRLNITFLCESLLHLRPTTIYDLYIDSSTLFTYGVGISLCTFWTLTKQWRNTS